MSSQADTDSDGTLSEEELNAMTVAQLKAMAAEEGWTLTATTKAAIVAEILEILNPSQDPDPDPDP